MKVAFLIAALQYGGAEKVAIDLIRHYRRRGVDCALVSLFRTKDEAKRTRLLEEMAAIGVPVEELDKRHGEDHFSALDKLNRTVKALRPDVIHAHGGMPNVYAGLRNIFYKRIRTVTTVHSGGEDWNRVKDRMLERISLHGVDRVVCVAEHIASHYTMRFPGARSKVTVIENGVDERRFRRPSAERLAEEKRALGLPEGVPVLIHVGRLVPLKNQTFLIGLASLLKEKGRPFRLLLVGNFEDESYSEEARRLIGELGLGEDVLLLGGRDNVDLLLQLSDLFLFPSFFEGYSLALTEAIIAGLPVVCSDIPANRRPAAHCEHARLLPFEPERWAEAVDELLRIAPSRQTPGSRQELVPSSLPASVPAPDRKHRSASSPSSYLTLDRVANDYLAWYPAR